MEATTLAYIAGLVDGEGYITIVRQKPNHSQISVRHNAKIVIGMCSEETIRWIASCFPNELSVYVKKMKSPNQKTAYLAIAVAHKAIVVLQQLRPYLRLKAAQADLAITFAERIRDGRVHRPVGQGFARVPDAEIAIREELYQVMRDLNQRGKGVQTTNPRSPSSLAADYHAPGEGV